MRNRIVLGLRSLLALVIAILFCLPLYWAVVASLRQAGLPPASTVEWWPRIPHWENYVEIFHVVPMARYLLNTLAVVAAAVPICWAASALAGFALAQLPDGPRRHLFRATVLLLFIPSMAVWLLRYRILDALGLVNTLWSLIVPAVAANPLFVLIFYWTYRRVPPELYEAARLDGASALGVWWNIARPLSWPASAAVLVLSFFTYWGNMSDPVLYIFKPTRYTVPIGLQLLNQLDPTNLPILMAGAVFAILPVVLLFLFLQRYFLHDLSLRSIFDKS